MRPLPKEADVLARLVAWGEAHPSIRALVLTSSPYPLEVDEAVRAQLEAVRQLSPQS